MLAGGSPTGGGSQGVGEVDLKETEEKTYGEGSPNPSTSLNSKPVRYDGTGKSGRKCQPKLSGTWGPVVTLAT